MNCCAFESWNFILEPYIHLKEKVTEKQLFIVQDHLLGKYKNYLPLLFIVWLFILYFTSFHYPLKSLHFT